jgi:hypothetical protein
VCPVRARSVAAQGLTVDTCHTVVTQTTSAEAFYVGMIRGRLANAAHVATSAVPAVAAPSAVLTAVHRSPDAVLAGLFETSDPQRSAPCRVGLTLARAGGQQDEAAHRRRLKQTPTAIVVIQRAPPAEQSSEGLKRGGPGRLTDAC